MNGTRKIGSGKPKGAGCYTEVSINQLIATFKNGAIKVPVKRVWFNQFDVDKVEPVSDIKEVAGEVPLPPGLTTVTLTQNV